MECCVKICVHLLLSHTQSTDGSMLCHCCLQTGAPSICLPAKQGSRTKCTHVSADGSTAVLLLFDSSIAIYDARSGLLKCQLMQRGDRDSQRVHSGGVNAVYLTADGSRAVSVSKDATARVWDTTSGQCTLVLQVCICCWCAAHCASSGSDWWHL
jgi:WD40 repeat protein